MEADNTEYCDICGRECDGVHSNRIYNKEKMIQDIVNMIMSYDENTIDEVIKRVYEIRKCKNV